MFTLIISQRIERRNFEVIRYAGIQTLWCFNIEQCNLFGEKKLMVKMEKFIVSQYFYRIVEKEVLLMFVTFYIVFELCKCY